MNILVIGYGHFAGVVASGLAQLGHAVKQQDEEPHLVRDGQRPPEQEPNYTKPMTEFVGEPHIVWIAYDVPLDMNGLPVMSEIEARIVRLHSTLPFSIPFLVSCQWPVGTTAFVAAQIPERELIYVMENVRVGKAIVDFLSCPFPVIGVRNELSEVTPQFIYKNAHSVSWESAEMAKHATNAFMALQVAFANEIADICKGVGADPQEVMSVVISDARVGSKAPLRPGTPFGGGSLKRDLLVLKQLQSECSLNLPIISAILPSNER